MKFIARLALLLLALAVLHACDKSGRRDSSPGDESDVSGEESSAGAALPLTEKRLQAYISYRKELHVVLKTYMEDIAKLSKKVDEKSNQLTKGVAAVQGMTQVLEKQENALKALRKKHGFEEREDERLWEAIGDVVGAKAMENPLLEPQVKMFREMQVKGGEENKSADEFFKNLETEEKENLAKARERYGAECVDLLSKHVKELHALQMDGVQQIPGPSRPGSDASCGVEKPSRFPGALEHQAGAQQRSPAGRPSVNWILGNPSPPPYPPVLLRQNFSILLLVTAAFLSGCEPERDPLPMGSLDAGALRTTSRWARRVSCRPS